MSLSQATEGVSGRARYLVPAAFVGATVAGTLYHLGAANLPLTEAIIALSVLGGGLSVLLSSMPANTGFLIAAVAGIVAGYYARPPEERRPPGTEDEQ